MNLLRILLWVLVAVAPACGQPTPGANNGSGTGRLVQRLLIEFDQRLVLPTSVLTFRLKGSDRMVPRAAQFTAEGSSQGADVMFEVIVTAPPEGFERTDGDQGDVLVKVPVDEGFWNQISPAPTALFSGAIRLELVDEIGVLAEASLEGMTLDFNADATPTLQPVTSGDFYSNEHIPVTGQNFLRPEEGNTWAVATGQFTYEDTALGARMIAGERTRIRWTGSRTNAEFHIDPGVFGIRPGRFEGSLAFVNELRNGQPFNGNTQPAHVMTLGQPFLAALDPPAGSRGQRIRFQGRGFVPQADDDAYVMFFRFDGIFTYDEGGELDLTGENALERPPDRVVSDDTAEMAVWYEIIDGRLYGLGASAGRFVGTITPIFQDRIGVFEGFPFEADPSFIVTPTKQVVFIKYLPGFSKGLEKYGLQNVEFEIRQRILQVTNRDYARLNVEFMDAPPTDFLEFATIEIGGPDPTGGGKFGYDNTCNVTAQKCKDTSNLFLGDYLGGINVNSADEYNTPFGGVFIESFDFFSPTLNPDNQDASTEFDRVLKPFMPALGGIAVKGTEFPNGKRDEAIREAIDVVGAVIGNTCTHEVGHSLGLAFFPQDLIRPGESFHNKIPGELYIMDSGSERPFSERGEIGGIGPARFNDRNMDYLLDILPLP